MEKNNYEVKRFSLFMDVERRETLSGSEIREKFNLEFTSQKKLIEDDIKYIVLFYKKEDGDPENVKHIGICDKEGAEKRRYALLALYVMDDFEGFYENLIKYPDTIDIQVKGIRDTFIKVEMFDELLSFNEKMKAKGYDKEI